MTHQEATAVVPVPLADVESRLTDVTRWSTFLAGVREVTETSFQRYRFVIADGGDAVREVDAAVVPHPREHRFAWHSLAGPRFDGEIRLSAVDDRHTRVHLSLVAEPAGFLAGLTEMLGTAHSTATVDLQRLEAHVAS